MLRVLLAFAAALAAAPRAVAEFNASNRSINGTGETLREGELEAGIGGLAYGVTPDVLVRVPTLSLLVGYGRAEGRHKHRLSERARLSPYAYVETPRHGGVGADYGIDLGVGREHSLTLGGRLRYGPLAVADRDDRPAARRRAVFRPNAEYDLYHRGNVVYAGLVDGLAYAGYTWAWTTLHLGLITSPASGFVPFPYVYWRL